MSSFACSGISPGKVYASKHTIVQSYCCEMHDQNKIKIAVQQSSGTKWTCSFKFVSAIQLPAAESIHIQV
jgi:hypothetical protein